MKHHKAAPFRKGLAVCSIGLVVMMSMPSLRAADTGCGLQSGFPSGFHGFDGVYVAPGPQQDPFVNRVDAEIKARSFVLCTSNTGAGASDWPLIAATDGGNHDGYAQIGYARNYGMSQQRFFTQWRLDQNTPHDSTVRDASGNEPTNGDFHTFTVVRASSRTSQGNTYTCPGAATFCLWMLLDNDCPTQLGHPFCESTNYDPQVKFPGTSGQFFGETAYPGDDMPGDDEGNTAVFREVTEKIGSVSGLHRAWGDSQDCPYYKFNDLDPGNNVKFEIFTKPTNHNHAC